MLKLCISLQVERQRFNLANKIRVLATIRVSAQISAFVNTIIEVLLKLQSSVLPEKKRTSGSNLDGLLGHLSALDLDSKVENKDTTMPGQ